MIKNYIFINSEQESHLKYASTKFYLFRSLISLLALIGFAKVMQWIIHLLNYLKKYLNKIGKNFHNRKLKETLTEPQIIQTSKRKTRTRRDLDRDS